MIESKKSKADIYVRSYREQFGLCNYDSLFFCLFVYFSAIMFIFFMSVELFWAWPSYTRIPRLPIPIHTHIRDTYYARVGCCKGECWLLNMFIIHFSIDWVKNSIAPFVPSFVSSYCPRCKRSLVSPSPVLYATDSLKGPQFCMHLVVKINV